MSAAPSFITYGPNAGGHPRNRDRSVIVHFLVGDSIGAGFGQSTDTPTSSLPSNCFLWGQNSLEYPGSRFEATANAASRVIGYGSGHGITGSATGNSIEPGSMLCRMLAAHTNPPGGGAHDGIDHVFASWSASAAQMNATPTNSTVGLYPGETGNDSFVHAHSVGLLDYIAHRGKWAGHVYIGGLFMVSLGGDASSVGEAAYVVGADAAYQANCTTFINDFRTSVGMTSANLPVIFGRAPTVGAGVTTLDRLSTVRTQTDNLDGSNGITVVSLDASERHSDDVHRTVKGYGQVAAALKAGFDSVTTTCPLWPGV